MYSVEPLRMGAFSIECHIYKKTIKYALNRLGARFSNRTIVWEYIIWVPLYLAPYNPLWVGNCLHGQVFFTNKGHFACLFCSNSNVSKQQLMRIPETLEFHERWTSEPRFQMEKKHSSLWDWVLYHASWPNVILLYLQGEICTVQELVLPLRPVGSLFPSNYLLL